MSVSKVFLVLTVMVVVFVVAPVQAINVTLTGGDGFGTSSFNTAGLWDNGLPPSAGNDYFNGGFLLRTPADPNSYSFAGDSLTITGPGLAGGPTNESLMWKGSGTTAVITVDDLTIDGGQLRHGQGDADTVTWAGNIAVGPNGANMHTQGGSIITAAVSGSDTIRILQFGNNDPRRLITFASGANTFTGDIELAGAQSRIALADDANLNFVIGASGVNNSISGGGSAVYDGDFVFDLSGASSNPGDSWNITSATTQSFGSTFTVVGFTESSDVWASGNYRFYESTGVLTVIPEPSSVVLVIVGLALVACCRRR